MDINNLKEKIKKDIEEISKEIKRMEEYFEHNKKETERMKKTAPKLYNEYKEKIIELELNNKYQYNNRKRVLKLLFLYKDIKLTKENIENIILIHQEELTDILKYNRLNEEENLYYIIQKNLIELNEIYKYVSRET